MKPIAFSSVVSAWPSTTIAPMSTMPWMKLLPDISGVCRITGTREMITWPAMAASMKMYKATNPSIIPVPRTLREVGIITAAEPARRRSTAAALARCHPPTPWEFGLHQMSDGGYDMRPTGTAQPADAAAVRLDGVHSPAPAAAATPPAADMTLEAFLSGVSTRAFRFAELGLRHREDAL